MSRSRGSDGTSYVLVRVVIELWTVKLVQRPDGPGKKNSNMAHLAKIAAAYAIGTLAISCNTGAAHRNPGNVAAVL
jgi:hypothetical protein